MSIFENLEELNVSEECFEDIINIVEEIINEDTISYLKKKEEEGKMHYSPKYWELLDKAEKAKKKGQEATEKKEIERIRNNKTRKDIHPSVLKSAEKRDSAIKNLSQNKTKTYLDDDNKSDDEKKASAIAQARTEGRENKRIIGLDKTLNKQKPVYYTDYGKTESGGGDPSFERLVRSTKDTDNHPYGNPNVNAENNIRNS